MHTLSKPGVPRSVHLFTAPFLWTTIGAALVYRGWGWLQPGKGLWLLMVAGLLGTGKSLLVLDKVARRSLDRIIRFQDGTCLGAVFSWQSWLLVLLMMLTGLLLRTLTQPGPCIGTLYCAIGWSLCLSSRLGWLEWFRLVVSHELS